MVELKLAAGSIQPGATVYVVDKTRKISASGAICRCGAGNLTTYRVKVDSVHFCEDASAVGVTNATISGMCRDSGLEGKWLTFVRVPGKQCFLTYGEAENYRKTVLRKKGIYS